MADIALLIAEDFERRMKRWDKGGSEDKGALEFRSTMAMASSALSAIEAKVAEELDFMEEVANRALVPRSSFTLAAFESFFSA